MRISTRFRSWFGFCLLAWPQCAMAGKSAADYYVTSIPGQPAGPLLNMHAGYAHNLDDGSFS